MKAKIEQLLNGDKEVYKELIGKYIRHKNYVGKILTVNPYSNCIFMENYEYGIGFTKKHKIVNTPAELLQVGDLIELYGNGVIIHLYNKFQFKKYRDDFKYIYKILTPNQDGGYDLQYSKEEE